MWQCYKNSGRIFTYTKVFAASLEVQTESFQNISTNEQELAFRLVDTPS